MISWLEKSTEQSAVPTESVSQLAKEGLRAFILINSNELLIWPPEELAMIITSVSMRSLPNGLLEEASDAEVVDNEAGDESSEADESNASNNSARSCARSKTC